jgi:AAHS family 4-hydroxybenzoate transporter-like MFS transporter
VLAYSLLALLMPFATSLEQVVLYRFLTGLGIGGVVPNVIALLSETAPKRYRVSAVMASFVGYSLGNATIGQVAAWLIPVFGWWIVFVTAGIAGVILFTVLVFALPESIQLLAAKQPASPRLRALVARARPPSTSASAMPRSSISGRRDTRSSQSSRIRRRTWSRSRPHNRSSTARC